MYCWYLIFLVQTLFLIIVSSMGRYSLQYERYFYFSGLCWTSTCILISIVVLNQRLRQLFSIIQKILIIIQENFISRYTFTSVHYMKKEKNTDGPPGCSPWILQTDFGLSPTIMPQGIVILHFPPASVMINKNLSILEIYYFRIHHPSLFLMNLCHSKT